jgi:copper(I)-binding protein
MTRTFLAALLSAAFIATPALASSKPAQRNQATTPAVSAVVIEAPWVREAPPGAEAMAGYMTLRNTGKQALKLLSAKSPQFKSVELHEVITVNGMARMQEVKELLLPAGGTLAFEPGSTHIMLIGPKKPLVAGDKVHVTLRLSNGREVSSTLPVRARHEQKTAPHSHPGHEGHGDHDHDHH